VWLELHGNPAAETTARATTSLDRCELAGLIDALSIAVSRVIDVQSKRDVLAIDCQRLPRFQLTCFSL